MGYEVLNLTQLRFIHARSYSERQTFNWSQGMRTLGYDPLLVAARIAKNILFAKEPLTLSANLRVLGGYSIGSLRCDDYSKPFDDDLRRFVCRLNALGSSGY